MIDNKARSYINAIAILTKAKIGAFKKIEEHFKGDWEKAWHNNLSAFIPTADKEESIKQKDINPAPLYDAIRSEGVDIITVYDNNYPRLLHQIAQPPFVIYSKGQIDILDNLCIGVVGTRNMSEYGRRATEKILEGFYGTNTTIVSGLARGIDTMAHNTALKYGLPTVAVIATGIDEKSLFPKQNIGLARQIVARHGLILSEYPLGTRAARFAFPQRNRIISGVSKGVVVVEADIKSGSLITARCAIEQNRDVFAVPGSIFASTSKGTLSLIKQGATPVYDAAEILESYGIETSNNSQKKVEADNEQEKKILELLTTEGVTIDILIRSVHMPTHVVQSTLVLMELKNKIRNLGNNIYALK